MGKQAGEGCEQGAVGRPQLRAARLAAQHRQLVSEHQQLNVFGERVPPAGSEQPQQRREGEIGEGEQHRPILAEPSTSSAGRTAATAIEPWNTAMVRVVVDRTTAAAIVARLTARDVRVGEDARAAVEWLTGADGDELPAVFSRRDLQLFLWYQLPRKWLIRPHEQQAVAEALALFFDEIGPEAASLAALCRSPQTAGLIRSGGKKLAAALEASGLEPPDTPLLSWSEFMSIEESLEHDLVADLLDDAIDRGELVPGSKGWQQQQHEIVERYLTGADSWGPTPLARIHAARRNAWLELHDRDGQRDLLEAALAAIENNPLSSADADAALEPLLWLLAQLADGVKLTQTGALPRALVRATAERYPDWWDTDTVGPPYQEAELYPLCLLHDLIDELKLARRQRTTLQLTPRGRTLRTDPQRLLTEITATIANQLPTDLDALLAQLVLTNQPDWSLHGLLAPFHGITGGHSRTAETVTPGGRILAAAILHARAHGPRNNLT